MDFALIQQMDQLSGKVFYHNPVTDGTKTYGEIKRLAETYATLLIRRASAAPAPAPAEQVVFIKLAEPHRMIPALLACWHHGLSPAILDPGTNVERLKLLSSLLDSRTIICDSEQGVDNALLDDYEFIRIDEIENTEQAPAQSLTIGIKRQETPALILFSSGTTGVPKCVPLSLENLFCNIAALAELIKLTSEDVFLCSSPYWYAHGLFNSFITSFILGARLIYPGILNVMNAAKTLKAAAEYGATVYHVTPSMLPILSMMGGRAKGPLPKFRYVISGTTRLDAEDKEKFEDVFRIPVSQQYGMTESLIMTLNYQCQKQKPDSVGVPFRCEMEVRDEKGNALPTGEIGEIAVRTRSAYGEYYQQPEETAAAYREGWFYTGDLGFLDRQARLTVTGRKKEIIKRGGFNISPFEINRVLLDFDGVAEAATVGVEDNVYGEDVYSFVVADKEISEQVLLDHCLSQLVKTHIPKRIFLVRELPKTSSGKVRTARLKEKALQLLK